MFAGRSKLELSQARTLRRVKPAAFGEVIVRPILFGTEMAIFGYYWS